jgi:8-oxo-dGTP diphosphatase
MDKYQKVAVHAYIKREDGKFLVTKRSPINDFLPNLFDLPGGTVEFGEDPKEALGREIFEETSLTVEIKNPIYIYTEVQKEVRHQIWIIYVCEFKEGEIKLNPEEHNEYKWVNFEETKDLPKIVFLEEFLKSSHIF